MSIWNLVGIIHKSSLIFSLYRYPGILVKQGLSRAASSHTHLQGIQPQIQTAVNLTEYSAVKIAGTVVGLDMFGSTQINTFYSPQNKT